MEPDLSIEPVALEPGPVRLALPADVLNRLRHPRISGRLVRESGGTGAVSGCESGDREQLPNGFGDHSVPEDRDDAIDIARGISDGTRTNAIGYPACLGIRTSRPGRSDSFSATSGAVITGVYENTPASDAGTQQVTPSPASTPRR